ncbi:head GIN domain-containing protein [Rufibacter sp. DG15C]|uniref:head GIN domain-containing protein n=1 Tax=Rufibacter sp. DG15C TaxID=1379909 RepID=UPI0009EC882E|nr:head GIN domain-containing protein [Rufibacter sp. DG15C]
MKKTTTFLMILMSFIGIASCAQAQDHNTVEGNGTIKSETRAVQGFTGLHISGGYEVFLTQGGQESLKIEGDANILPLIETKVTDGVLYVASKNNVNIRKAKGLKLYVTVKDLKTLDLNGGIKLSTTNPLKGTALKLDASGGMHLDMDLDLKDLKVDLSGGSDITLRGTADNVTLEVSGATNLKATELKTQYLALDASGAGNAEVFASKELKVDASGIMSVGYKGSPKVQHTGMGKVKPL